MTGEITEADRLSAALAGLPQTLRAAAELPMPDLRDVALRSRRFICAGLGSSSAHARFLAAQLSASGMAAQALPLGSEGLRRGDALLIFSQV